VELVAQENQMDVKAMEDAAQVAATE